MLRRLLASVPAAAVLAAALAWLSAPSIAPAQIPGTANIQVGGTNILGGTNGRCLFDNSGKIGEQVCGGAAAGITVGTSVITGGTTTRVLFDNAGVLGEYTAASLSSFMGLGTASTQNTGTSGATVPLLNGANTWGGVQTFSDGNALIGGSSSGTLQLRAAATAGTSVVRFPNGSTDFSATGGTSQVVKQTGAGAALTVAQLATTDLSDTTAPTAWTPVLVFGASSAGITYTTQSGTYTKVGKLVTASFRITLSSKGVQTGAATLTGLPVAVAAGLNVSGTCSFFANMAGLTSVLGGYAGTTTWNFTSGGTTTSGIPTETSFTNTSDMICSITYPSV